MKVDVEAFVGAIVYLFESVGLARMKGCQLFHEVNVKMGSKAVRGKASISWCDFSTRLTRLP